METVVNKVHGKGELLPLLRKLSPCGPRLLQADRGAQHAWLSAGAGWEASAETNWTEEVSTSHAGPNGKECVAEGAGRSGVQLLEHLLSSCGL